MKIRVRRHHLICAAAMALTVAVGCGEDNSPETGNNGNNGNNGVEFPADLEVCNPADGPFTATIDNPWLPMAVGSVHVIEGLEAGVDPSRSRRTILDETEEIFGVTARVAMDENYEGEDLDELVAMSRNFFAQAPDGTVCSFGETEDLFEDGEFLETEGWAAGEDGALPSIAMPGTPDVGLIFYASYRPEDEEVEQSEITAIGDTATTPAGTFDNVMTVVEVGPSIKKYAFGVGEIFDDGLELASY